MMSSFRTLAPLLVVALVVLVSDGDAIPAHDATVHELAEADNSEATTTATLPEEVDGIKVAVRNCSCVDLHHHT